MKKRIMIFCVAASSMLLAGCQASRQKEAVGVSDTFVSSYYKGEYETAAEVCDGPLKSKVLEVKGVVDSLPEGIRSEFMELSSKTETTMKEVLLFSGDSAEVLYEVFIPENVDLLKNVIVLRHDEESGSWKVVRMTE